VKPVSIDIYAEDYKRCFRDKKFSEPAENLIRAVKIEGITPKNDRNKACDFGSGDGRHTEYLLKAGYEVLATDVSREAVRSTEHRVRQFKKARVILMRPNSRIDSPDNVFNMIVSWETMHWLGSKKLFLFYIKEFRRVLKKNGYVIMTMPTETHYLKHFSEEIGESQYLCNAPERRGAIFYSPNLFTLKKILHDRYQFKIKRIMRYDHGRTNDSRLTGMGLQNLFSMYVLILKYS